MGKRDGMRRNGTREADASPAQELAIAALMRGATVTEAAAQAGVGRQTVHRWLASDPAFIAALNRERRDRRDYIQSELRSLASEAVKSLRATLDPARSVPEAVRLRAALAVIEMNLAGATALGAVGATDAETVKEELDNFDLFRDLGRVHLPCSMGEN